MCSRHGGEGPGKGSPRHSRAGYSQSFAAFYDPGLGSAADGGHLYGGWPRLVYNKVSEATGLGITANIIDCYAALIRLWKPGDRIFLFGFSRGAYTIRCLAAVIAKCGIPTHDQGGGQLKLDAASTRKIAAYAVKHVYQFISSRPLAEALARPSSLSIGASADPATSIISRATRSGRRPLVLAESGSGRTMELGRSGRRPLSYGVIAKHPASKTSRVGESALVLLAPNPRVREGRANSAPSVSDPRSDRPGNNRKQGGCSPI